MGRLRMMVAICGARSLRRAAFCPPCDGAASGAGSSAYQKENVMRLIIETIGAPLLASAAFGGDIPTKAPALQPAAPSAHPLTASPWDGLFIGGNIGYGWSTGNYTASNRLKLNDKS
jgi:hypothetical protein